MKFQFYITTLFLICIFNSSAIAQDPFDCIDALVVCDNSTLEIEYNDVVGNAQEEVDDFCTISTIQSSILDFNTIWIKYQFITDGDFYFTVSSPIQDTDIDFVVFTSPSKSCDDLEPIRCMFTGANAQGQTDSICIGPTGLSPSSIDTFEEPGCLIGSDNFLAPVNVDAGEVLYLAVINFSFTNSQYSITHVGSAEISCSVGVEEINHHVVNVFPNPANDEIIIPKYLKGGELKIFDVNGKLVIDHKNLNPIINISSLEAAKMYFLKVQKDGIEYSSRFVKD